MKHYIRLWIAGLLSALFLVFGMAQTPQTNKWNPEARAFLSLYNQYKTQKSKDASIEQRLMDDYGMYRHTDHRKSQRDYMTVFLEFETPQALQQAEQAGFLPQTRLDGICTGLLPLDAVNEIEGIEGIKRISTSLKNHLDNDLSRVASKVNGVQAQAASNKLPKAYDGSGVVVGIIDAGFDYTHPTFFTNPDDNSTYRVKKVWDQRATTGTPPQGFTKGAEYVGTTAILAAQHDQDDGDHATHVAGTAGGSGAGTNYQGMAPACEYVFVATTMNNADIFDGITYIKRYAESVKKPCVINMSLGSNIGPHDGTSDFDRACNQIVGDGFILVGSAGNSGASKVHIKADMRKADTTVGTQVTFGKPESAVIDCWGNNKKDFVVRFGVVVNTNQFKYVEISSTSADGVKREVVFNGQTLATVTPYCWDNEVNEQPRLYLSINAKAAVDAKYPLYVQFKPTTGATEPVVLHAWLASGVFENGDTEYTHNGSISAGDGVLSVAAYVTRQRWIPLNDKTYHYSYSDDREGSIGPFSSRGPLANGKIKPDIAAPGTAIFSASNSFINKDAVYIVDKTTVNGKDYPWVVMQGTSMSAPAVTGIVALFLQADSSLNITRLKKLLSETAVNDAETGPARTQPNARWGYGKIDALSAIKALQPVPQPDPKYRVNIQQSEGGTISVMNDQTPVQSGDSITLNTALLLKAEAQEGYIFTQWWDGNTEAERAYAVKENVTISATFEEMVIPQPDPKYRVNIQQSEGGTITVMNDQTPVQSGDSITLNTALVLRAEAQEAYDFVQWWDGNTATLRSYVLSENITISATFRQRVGIENVENEGYKIHPNPSDGLFTFSSQEAVTVKIFSPQGRLINTFVCAPAAQQLIDLRHEASGIYYLHATRRHQTDMLKVIKK